MKVIFINSHPIQYFAPLYKYLNIEGLTTECWYCSDENFKGHLDKQFGVNVKWDIPLLEGYPNRFFKNRAPRPSIYNGFFGLFNPGMALALFKEKKSLIVVHGWAYLTSVLVIICARMAGHHVCLRGESPLDQELLKSRQSLIFKKLVLGKFLFSFVNTFLFIGKKNKAFYQFFGVQEKKLIFVPYCVDNDRFAEAYRSLKSLKAQLRNELQIPVESKVILFSAKYILKKRPLDLLKSFHLLNDAKSYLVMVGDGELRQEMEKFIAVNNMKNVLLAGFVNQSSIVKYYTIADAFVLCSGRGETWGLSVNEALNFNLPVVVSDICGCATDLVVKSENGFTVKSGDVEELAYALKQVMTFATVDNSKILHTYSYHTIHHNLLSVTRSSL